MKTVALDLPTFGFVIVTRAVLGAGVGLLVAERLSDGRRRAIGKTLVAIGAATTLPAIAWVMRSFRRSNVDSLVNRDDRLRGVTRFPRKGDDAL
jgi:hypothetical protein